MKRLTIFLTAAAALFYLSAMPMFAQHGPGGGHGAGGGGGHATLGSRPRPNNPGGGGKSTHAESKERLTSFFNDTDSKLYQKVSKLLPSGTTVADLKTMGFKNLGQLIATVHVYNNLGLASKGVSFSTFAGQVTAKGGSLGKAIQKSDPTANTSSETKKGKHQANDDLNESS